ncbi:hypothetical protein IV102_15805 [bacterium]|nr:hypothetical protein [bacterium]
MRAADCWQELGVGIELMNLLAYYPAPGNPAVRSALEGLLAPGVPESSLADLKGLEKRLRQLPAGSGEEAGGQNFGELEAGPLQALMRRLSWLHALYLGKEKGVCTAAAEHELDASARLFEDVQAIRQAVGELILRKG